MSWFAKENFICDQTIYECIIWWEVQMTLKTEQAPISIAETFFVVSEVTRLRLSVQSMLNVLCTLPILSAGPLLSDDCVFYCMSSRYFICQILFQHYRHDITTVSAITSTCWTTMRKHSTWQVIKMLNPGELCIYNGWMYVCLFVLFIYLIEGPCMRLDDINQSYCQQGNISMFLWMFWKKNKNQWQCQELWKMKYLSITSQRPSIQE